MRHWTAVDDKQSSLAHGQAAWTALLLVQDPLTVSHATGNRASAGCTNPNIRFIINMLDANNWSNNNSMWNEQFNRKIGCLLHLWSNKYTWPADTVKRRKKAQLLWKHMQKRNKQETNRTSSSTETLLKVRGVTRQIKSWTVECAVSALQ